MNTVIYNSEKYLNIKLDLKGIDDFVLNLNKYSKKHLLSFKKIIITLKNCKNVLIIGENKKPKNFKANVINELCPEDKYTRNPLCHRINPKYKYICDDKIVDDLNVIDENCLFANKEDILNTETNEVKCTKDRKNYLCEYFDTNTTPEKRNHNEFDMNKYIADGKIMIFDEISLSDNSSNILSVVINNNVKKILDLEIKLYTPKMNNVLNNDKDTLVKCKNNVCKNIKPEHKLIHGNSLTNYYSPYKVSDLKEVLENRQELIGKDISCYGSNKIGKKDCYLTTQENLSENLLCKNINGIMMCKNKKTEHFEDSKNCFINYKLIILVALILYLI